MSKLSLDALAERADQVATEDLLSSINGGTENDCHPEEEHPNPPTRDNIPSWPPYETRKKHEKYE